MSILKGTAGQDSGVQVQPNEPQKNPGYVKEKIRASTPKSRGLGRPRAHRSDKIIKRAEKKLSEILKFASDDVAAAMQVLRDQLKATKGIWDINAKCMVQIPDEKIRQDAALAILAYEWGRPTEKKLVAVADAEDFQAMLDRFQASPVAQEKFGSSLLRVEGKEITAGVPEARIGDKQSEDGIHADG